MPESPHNSDPFPCNLAVVIGINQYQNGISELRTARFDAERLAGILQTKYGYEVKLFIEEQAQSNNIWNYLKTELSQKIKSYENKLVRLLFYFAGHGSPPEGEDGEAGYLVPQDGQISKRDKWLSMKEIHYVLTQLRCHHLLIILDCCYAGAFRFGTRHVGVMPEDLSKERYQRYIEYPAGQVIASTAHNREALDIINDNRGSGNNSNNSPFAEFLFKALEDGDADYTKDGITTVTELNLYLYENLLELTENQQHPQVSRTWFLPTLDKGEFFFQTGEFDPEKLPEAIAINKENNPYRGLKSFEEAHSRFFFGRSEKIEELEERLNTADQPLTVVLGISGSGKSSLVKAGLIPKLRENQAQWRILEPICPGATVFKDLARSMLPLTLESSDPDLEPLKQLDELLRQARRRAPHDEELKALFAKWRRTAPEDKLLLIIKHFNRLKELCGDEAKQQSLKDLRKIALSRSRLVLDNLEELKQYCNSAEREGLDNFYQKCKKHIQDLSEDWKKDVKKLGEFIVQNCPENKQVKLLLVIDQFEQAIAQCRQEERKQFLNTLHSALKACPRQLRLVLTLRSDFQHYFENSAQLREYWEQACFPVKQMERDQLREAIEQPALAQVLYFETNENGKSLVDQLLDDVGETPGALPLLSFTLSELYYKYVQKQRGDRTLTWEDYTELGGVTQSLTCRATEEYNNLAKDFVDGHAVAIDPSEAQGRQTMARWVMLRMVTLDGGEKAKRRVLIDPSEQNELKYTDRETNERRELVINRFVDARLLVTGINIEGKSYVEPVHDVLIREWDKITIWLSGKQEEVNGKQNQPKPKPHKKGWFGLNLPSIRWNKKPERGQERFNLNLQRELTIAAFKYKEASQKQPQKAVDWLWDDNPQLPLAEQIYRSTDNWLNEVEADFVRRSIKKKQTNTIVRWSIAGSVLVGAMSFSFAVWTQWRNSELNLANSLAQTSLSLFNEGNELDASVAAIKAGKILQTHQEKDPQVLNALLKAVYESSELKQLYGHQDWVMSVSFSPDGKTLVSGSADNTIKFWNLETGKDIRTLSDHWSSVLSVSFSPNGQLLASGSGDGTIKLWNTQTGKLMNTFYSHEGLVMGVSFSPNGQTLASGGDDGTIKLWNVGTGKLIFNLSGHDLDIYTISVSPDGKTLASGGRDRTIKLWNIETEELIRTLDGHQRFISSISFSPDGKTLGSSSKDGTIKIWNIETGELMLDLPHNQIGVDTIDFSPDGQTLGSGGDDGTMKIWNLGTGELIHTIPAHTSKLETVNFSPDGQILASGSQDNTIKFWSLTTGLSAFAPTFEHGSSVSSIDISPDGQTLVSSGDDGTIKLWSLQMNKVIDTFGVSESKVESVSISPDGQILASGSEDGAIKLWKIETGELIRTLPGHLSSVSRVNFSPDGQTLVSSSDDKTIKLWNPNTGEVTRTLRGHVGSILSVDFSPDGQTLASSSNDGTIKLWNLNTGEVIQSFDGQGFFVTSVSFSPDGKTLVSGSWNKKITIWDIKEGKPFHILSGHNSFVNSVSVSPDGQQIISGSNDNTIKLWNLETGEEITTFIGHSKALSHVIFSPNGQQIISGSADETIKIWDINLDSLIKHNCDRIRNYLQHNPNVTEKDRRLCDGI